MNIPYVKQYDAKGDLINPIIDSYFNKFANGVTRRKKLGRAFNNKKGIQLVVTQIGNYQFTKYKKVIQYLKGKSIVHYIES